MKLSELLKELDQGFSFKISSGKKLRWQLQKRVDLEIVFFDWFGNRTIKYFEDHLKLISTFIKFDKKSKFYSKKLKDNYTNKFIISKFKRPIRKAAGAAPINLQLELYFKEKQFSFLPEFRTFVKGSTSIADYVSIQGDFFVSYEVKSDVDSFVRLEKQINDYLKFSDKVFLVLHEKKEKLFYKQYKYLLKDIGLIIYNGKSLIIVQDAPYRPIPIDYELLIYKEKVAVFKEFKGRSKIVNRNKCFYSLFPKKIQRKIVFSFLKSRFDKRIKKDFSDAELGFSLLEYQEKFTKKCISS